MTDRELLELAAKAAGYTGFISDLGRVVISEEGRLWNPLTDDGDAFRLMVLLHFLVQVRKTVSFVTDEEGRQLAHRAHRPHGDDPYAATRRAIVRAAAEIGRGME